LIVWTFVLASACHLWLADAWQLEWLFADLVYLVGLGLLAWRGAFAGWVLSALGLALPLLFHRDQLTQSVFLLFVATAGAVTTGRAAWRVVVEGQSSAGDDDERPRGLRGFSRTIQWLAILVYGFAFFHKLNADFFDPQYSCAVYGLREVTDYWHLPAFEMSASTGRLLPIGILMAEGGIAVLHLLRYRRIAWTVAVAFHIFLTFTMAPAFVFVMAVGHVAFVTHDDLAGFRNMLARWGPWLIVIAAVVTVASLRRHGTLPEYTMIPREFLLWGVLALLVTTFPPWSAEARARRTVRRPSTWFARALPPVFAVLFALNCALPYLGLQYQHTAAMVSNLRIDRGCWNHLVVPESARLQDPYIRVEEVYFGEPGRDPEYEKIVREQLWSPPQIRQMRRNWCSPANRPFYLKGTYKGESFEIEDLCAGEPLPFGEFRVFGIAVFGDLLRFQKNLMRECPQTCIH
ncbi:MAG: hypothetical protein ABEN55_10415, partial [Bradymonadaceae bacterium]